MKIPTSVKYTVVEPTAMTFTALGTTVVGPYRCLRQRGKTGVVETGARLLVAQNS